MSSSIRILPAHVKEAESMAAALADALEEFGITSDCRDPDSEYLTIVETQEYLAKAMGYAGWEDLSVKLREAHEPVYLDLLGQEGTQKLMSIVEKFAGYLGYNYAHGFILNAFALSGVGYTPKARRALDEQSTPWGVIIDGDEEDDEIAPGIRSVSTSGHGGIIVSLERQKQIPEHLRLDDVYYEEDTDWALVILAFPNELSADLKSALASVGVYSSASVPRIRDNTDPRYEALMAECQLGYIPPDKDPMNRPVTPEEATAIEYLASCVYANRLPVVKPDDDFPTLQDWVKALEKAPRLDGKLPMRSMKWRGHWGQWQRLEDDQREREESWQRALAEYKPPNNDDVDK